MQNTMKSKINFLFVVIVTVFTALGCSRITDQFQPASSNSSNARNSNQTVVEKTIEDVADGESTGVPECDEVMRMIADQSNKPDDNLATKTAKDFFLGQIKKSLRESFEKNGQDKAKMAQQCTDLKKSLEKNVKKESNTNK